MIEKPWLVRSALHSHCWPAAPSSAGAQVLALMYQLENSQWFTPAQLQALQFVQIRKLLQIATQTVPFIRQRFIDNQIEVEHLDEVTWQKVPLTSREDLQLAGDAMINSACPAEHGQQVRTITSGSTGKPVAVLLTGLTDLFWQAFALREHLWHQRDFAGKLAAIRTLSGGYALPPAGIENENWGPATLAVVETGRGAALNISATIAEQADWLLRVNPDYLLTYPSNLAALIRFMQDQGQRLSRLREARTFGEAVEPALRRACREAWGVTLTDVYSCQEAGTLALQCPEAEHYHVQCENVLLEVLDSNGRACLPGETGRVVITTLHNYATPLIRYELGDYAEVGEPCRCGRGLPVLNRIWGRQRNLFVLPDGSLRWPVLELDSRLRPADLPPVRQFQIIQHSIEEIEAVLAVYRPLSTDEEQRLIAWLAACLRCDRFRVRFTYVEHIPSGANGKFEDFISRVALPTKPVSGHG